MINRKSPWADLAQPPPMTGFLEKKSSLIDVVRGPEENVCVHECHALKYKTRWLKTIYYAWFLEPKLYTSKYFYRKQVTPFISQELLKVPPNRFLIILQYLI